MTGRHTVPTAQMPNEAAPIAPGTQQTTPAAPPARQESTRPDTGFLKYLPRTLMATNVILLVLLAFQLTHRPKYEYMTTAPSDYTFNEEMNKLGAWGWKTESCRRATSGGNFTTTASYECIMSRPKLGW
ncbi:hypothetical protein L1280_001521 [Deinococcus sp. HSC-46F16]|uniref:hypothetical protein n=1 Tax=Deinococcus sp. HSC-46F16 TaxID=2910968 RepID=UPI00209E5FE5|nr:hypothetical protein [Deinococcus sp. HSC-46F16]MCP2014384.1 hypothetical protein [Deinococcus sp. HSC-46F16]